MAGTLETLLVRIRDGLATADEREAARDLALHDARLPSELRGEVLRTDDEAPSDAAGLLAVLGVDDLFGEALREAVAYHVELDVPAPEPATEELVELDEEWVWGPMVAEAVRAEAGEVELADAVLARVERGVESDWVYGPVLAEAVRRAAGRVSLAATVLDVVGETVPPVAEAVRAEAGTVDSAAAVLGTTFLPVGDAVRAEAGRVEVAATVASSLGFAVLPVADAVRAEAGRVDVGGAFDAGLPIGDAVRAAAGRVDLAPTFDAPIPVDAAVRAEAGTVDLWGAIAEDIAPSTDVADEGPLRVEMPSSLANTPVLPAPANRPTWQWGTLLMAAVVLFVLGTSQFVVPSATGPAEPAPMQFASASEIIVDDLEWADTVNVMQAEGDEGALIIWVDEGVTL